MKIEFYVPAVPKAQPRPRVTVRGEFAHAYTPKTDPVNAFKAAVMVAAGLVYSGPPLDDALGVRLHFVMPRPKYKTKKRSDNPRYWHIIKPDVDNLAKSVLDALTGKMWKDDTQVAELCVVKEVASADESPGVSVSIRELES